MAKRKQSTSEFKIDQEVFFKATLQKAVVKQKMLVHESEEEDPIWMYRVQFPKQEQPAGEIFPEEIITDYDGALKVLKEKTEELTAEKK